MSISTIVASVAALVAAQVSELKTVSTYVPRLTALSTQQPVAVVWIPRSPEQREAGMPGGGLVVREHQVQVHVMVYGRDPSTDLATLETIMNKLRLLFPQYPDGPTGTGIPSPNVTNVSKVLQFGQQMWEERSEPDGGMVLTGDNILWESRLTVVCEEGLNA